MKKVKRRLTEDEEFQVMKLVLDKFLWIGTILMVFGLYICISKDVNKGFWYILSGAIVMLVFAWIIVKEFERIR
ncbi:hypothetical protein DRJ22_03300 [Candidatus Woesearchaeota archaeon]|nr:MAG: hypothetical protein DRJ22_03300 [Candidatus Woesearchaeota archaeon]